MFCFYCRPNTREVRTTITTVARPITPTTMRHTPLRQICVNLLHTRTWCIPEQQVHLNRFVQYAPMYMQPPLPYFRMRTHLCTTLYKQNTFNSFPQYRDMSKYYSFNASMKSPGRPSYPFKSSGISPLGSRSPASGQDNGKVSLWSWWLLTTINCDKRSIIIWIKK